MDDAQCSVEGCTNPVLSRGWCKPHYGIAYRHGGNPLAAQIKGPRSPCKAEGCSKTSSTDYCHDHATRLRKYGDPNWRKPEPERPSYFGVHQRIHSKWGAAKDQECVDCLGDAEEWALIGEPKWWDRPGIKPYTDDLDAYIPLCRRCHRRRDRPDFYHCEHGYNGVRDCEDCRERKRERDRARRREQWSREDLPRTAEG